MTASLRALSALAAITAATFATCTVAQAEPGLLAVYTDGKATVHRVVPTPNFTLSSRQSVHSQIAPKFEAVYTGVLKISRGGEYTIAGDAEIQLDGKAVTGKPVKLTAGDHPLKISYRRKADAARLQLRWKAGFVTEEPIPPSAFGHSKPGDALIGKWAQIEHGRLLYENLSCGACHGANEWNLSTRRGPDLSAIGSRATGDWLATWLKNPQHYRATAAMPSLLSDETEVRDVATYLSGLVEKKPAGGKSPKNQKRIDAGKEIFGRVGCANCHGEKGTSLAAVGSKFKSSGALTSYLVDPLHVDPSGRMPQMFDPKTQADEAAQVAEYLFHTNRSEAGWSKLAAGGDASRGKTLVTTRGCVACHTVKDGGRQLASELKSPNFSKDKKSGFDPQKGCLAAAPANGTPNYKLAAVDRASLQVFMASVAQQPIVAKAPGETFYRRISQHNCTACHALNDKNIGPSRVVTDEGKIRTIELPPTLTAAGDKLQVSWIRKVLLEKKRTRPWMKMRMPHFGNELKQLPELFPVASGSPLKDEAPQPTLNSARRAW